MTPVASFSALPSLARPVAAPFAPIALTQSPTPQGIETMTQANPCPNNCTAGIIRPHTRAPIRCFSRQCPSAPDSLATGPGWRSD